jgi:hypothetical protein
MNDGVLSRSWLESATAVGSVHYLSRSIFRTIEYSV